MKITKLGISGLGKNALGAVAEAVKASNHINSGNLRGAGTYNGASGRKLAKLARKQGAKALKVSPKKFDKLVNKAALNILKSPGMKQVLARSRGAGAGAMRDSGLKNLASSFPSGAKKNLGKTVGSLVEADGGYSGGGRRRGSSSRGGKKAVSGGVGFDLDFLNEKDEKQKQIMAKKFNYKNSDVFQNSSASLFKVLSVRYQRSAYRRLFDNEDTIEADKANSTDIRR